MSKALDRSQRAGSDPIQIGNTKLVTDSNNDLTVQDTSSNTKKLIASEVHIGTGSDKVILKRSSSDGKLQLQTTDGSSTTDSEVSSDSSSGSGTTVYANIAAMVAVSSPAAGSQALVTANKGLYIYNGSGWYKIATVNTSPALVSPATGTDVTLSSEGTATTIELVATDADEGTTLQYSYTVSSGSLTNGGGTTATVTSSATSNGTYSALAAGASTTNRFIKITPTTTASHAGNFSLNFSISDGTNAATTVQNFGLAFAVSGSLYFDGTGDYLSIADSDDWHFGTGDFTLEAWVYSNSFANGYNGIISQWPQNGGNANNSFVLETVGSNLNFYTVHGGTTLTSHTGSITLGLNQWHHVAVQRSSGTIKSYVNGTEDFSVSNNNNFNNPSSPLTVGGGVVGTGGSWNGYISNARVVKGSTVYTPTIPNVGSSVVTSTGLVETPASLPSWGTTWTLETWIYITTNASYSIFFEGANGFGYIARRSSGGTLDLYSIGGYLDTPGSGTINLNQWHHIAISVNSGALKAFIDGTLVSSGTANTAPFSSGSGQLHMMSQGDTVWQTKGYMSDTRLVIGTSVYSGAFTPPSGALTKTGGTYPSNTNVNTSFSAAHTYLLTNRTTSGTTIADDSDQNYTMVTGGNLTGSTTKPYSNYITVPTSPLSAITNTKLLVAKNSDLVSGAATSDSSSASRALTFVGDTRFSHVTPFIEPSGGSTDFIGATGTSNNGFTYVDSPVSSAVSPGNGDFTIEYWINSRDISAGTQMPFDYDYATASGLMMYINTSGRLVANQGSSILLLNDGTGSAPVMANNTWYHVALCRNSGQLRLYQNGILCTNTAGYGSQDGSHPFTSNLTQTRITIGVKYFGGHDTFPCDGSISNFRLVVGTAVYTGDSSFTPPTSPLTAITNTQLLTCQNSTGTIADASSNNLTMVVGSGAVASKHNPF